MKLSMLFAWSVVLAFGWTMIAHGQGTIVFNNLDESNGLVTISPRGLIVFLNQDLNFELLAGPPGEVLQLIQRWLLSDGSAKGINVAPGRFADPRGRVLTIPGVAPGEGAVIIVRAWAGNYDSFNKASLAGVYGGETIHSMRLSPFGALPSGLLGMSTFFVPGVPEQVSPLTLGLGWSNGLPQLRITGWLGNSYALEYASALGATNSWRSLLNQTTWVLTNNPQFFMDTSATGMAQRFYRIGPPPAPPPPSLVRIDPGTFLMGSPTNDPDAQLFFETPQTQVTLTYGFWIGKYEITQIEYQALSSTNPSSFIGDMNRPVETVTWKEAKDYCARLTEQERVAGRLPAGYAYRLPTEVEWEFVARAGTTNRFSYGDDPGYTELGKYAWYAANSGDQAHPVGQKEPHAWGVYDLYGNVAEWCLKWADRYPGGSVVDPIMGGFPIARGGSYNGNGASNRIAFRPLGSSLGNGVSFCDFRLVLAPVQP